MAESSAHEAVKLISSVLPDFTDAFVLLKQDRIRLRIPSDIIDALYRRLTAIKTRLLNILALVLDPSTPLQHLGRESGETQLIRSILRGCAATVFVTSSNLKSLARDDSNVQVPWDQTLGLLETFDGSLRELAPIETISGIRFELSNQDAVERHVLRALDAKATFGESEALGPAQLVHQSSDDGNASPEQRTRAHLNCEGYNRGLEEGHRRLHQEVCDTLKAMNIVDGGSGQDGNVTLLAQAIKRHDIKGVNLLLDLGADVNGLSPQAGSQEPKDLPLCIASKNGFVDVVDTLLARGARIEARNVFGNTPLLSAAAAGRVSMAKYLVKDYHADIEATKGSMPRMGYTPLATAAYFGRLKTLQSLIDEGANTRVLSRKGETLLHIAANQGHQTIVEQLIQTGAQIGEQNTVDGDTALHYAIMKGRMEVAQYLIDRMPSILKISNIKAQTPLHVAVKYKQLEMVKLLLSHDVETRAQDNLGETPLQYAMSVQDDESNTPLAIFEEFLVRHRPGELFDRGFHALSQAARDNNHLRVEKIVERDPSLIKVLPSSDSGFYPALHEAARHGRESIVKLLGRCPETNPNLADRNGDTPLHHAILNGQNGILDALFAIGADVNLANTKNGYYPLHYAAKAQNYGAMKKLVKRRANPSIRIPGPACDRCRAKHRSGMNARCVLLNLPTNIRSRDFADMDEFLRETIKR